MLPAIAAPGWSGDQVLEQLQMQNPEADHVRVRSRGRLRIADYVLVIGGVPLVVVEAKREYRDAAEGIQQVIDYAVRLDAPLAVGTNGHGYMLHDRTHGTETRVASLPTPQ